MNQGIDNVIKFDFELRKTTLGSLGNIGSTRRDPMPVQIGHDPGHSTLNMPMSEQDYWEISDVTNELRTIEPGQETDGVGQRLIDKQHATDIALYLLEGLVTSAWQKLEAGQQFEARQELEAEGEEVTRKHTDIISCPVESGARSAPSRACSHGCPCNTTTSERASPDVFEIRRGGW
jgi:hypothetical protein